MPLVTSTNLVLATTQNLFKKGFLQTSYDLAAGMQTRAPMIASTTLISWIPIVA